jgi:hypothetical protein
VRKINTRSFVRATRSTPREINRQIVLNLVREHQPISRADLARRMHVGRGMVTSIVSELLVDGSIYEGSTVEAPRGRKPMMLHVRTHDRLVVAVDVRSEQSPKMSAPIANTSLPTAHSSQSRKATNQSAWYGQYAKSSRSKKFFLQYPGQSHP